MSDSKPYNKTLGAIRNALVVVLILALMIPARPTLHFCDLSC